MRAEHLSFYLSLLLSRLADQILLFLVPLVVYQQTQSAAWTGVAFFVETLARFAACPVCGVLCDRRPALGLLRASQTLRAVACLVGLLAAWTFSGPISLGVLVLVGAACGVFTTQGLIAREVMLPHIFPEARLEKVIAHAQIADQLGMVAGPLLAAAALALLPWQGVLACSGVLFLVADGFLLWWQRASTAVLPTPRFNPLERWWQPMGTALAHIWTLPGFRGMVVVTAAVNLVLGVTLATAAAMVTGLLQQSTAAYATLQTAAALATVVVLALVAHLHWRGHSMGLLSFAGVLVGGALTAVGGSYSVYALGFLLVISFDKMFSVYIRAWRQRIIPPADFGKTSGMVILLNNLTQPLAGLAVGLGAQGADASGVIGVLSSIAALAGLAGLWMVRSATASTATPTTSV
jgi:MFS family permease